MPTKRTLAAIYEIVLRAEIAITDAMENEDEAAADDEIAIAIGQLELATQRLKTLRKKRA